MAGLNKKKLNNIAKKVKYLKEIGGMKLTKEEKGYVHSAVKAQSVKTMKKANKKKYGK